MSDGFSIGTMECAVCGSREVRTDLVEQNGWLLLAECPRCDHRSTRPLREVRAPARVAVPVARPEVANAA